MKNLNNLQEYKSRELSKEELMKIDGGRGEGFWALVGLFIGFVVGSL